MMMSLTNMFTKEDMEAGKGCIETGAILQSGNSNYFAILQKKWQITTFAMIQPKIEGKMFTVDLVVSKDK